MMGLRPRQGNPRLVFILFKSYALQASHKRLNNLKTTLRFPCLGLNPIIDSVIILLARGIGTRRIYYISDEFKPEDSESDDEETIDKDEEGIDEVSDIH